ncbi:MAG: 3'-5' exonuclease, partial [Gammaproteobacteria bacterium]
VRQMPVTAGMAAAPLIEEDPTLLHRDAAREALAAIAEGGRWRQAIARVLGHLDNDWYKLELLLADMLARRDQWLRVTGANADRAALEQAYARVVAAEIAALAEALPPGAVEELVALGAHAGAHLDDSPLSVLEGVPAATPGALALWHALADLLLTRAGAWRAKVDKRDGFPADGADNKAMKQRLKDLVTSCREVTGLRARFVRIRLLPAAPFAPGEWETVEALFDLLHRATAHLMVLGDLAGRADFTAFSMAALDALGAPEQPTDLALSLDYQLRHLLIDEFQDTSISQFELVRRLTAGWSTGDGRTLFLVGDPMQSIYRFRQADVSLFRRVLDDGRIGSVGLEPLALVANFRAQAALVDWINALVPEALAAADADDAHFVAQHAVRPALVRGVSVHGFDAHAGEIEAARVADIIADVRAREPDASIAVLVRSRTHLADITTLLRARGVPLVAREIKAFADVPVVADLVALARALLHEADRVAWIAVLRAPWCGVRLATLAVLAQHPGTLLEAIEQAGGAEDLAGEERARLARVAAVFATVRREARQRPFAECLELAWMGLGGPALLEGEDDVAAARVLLDVVAALEQEEASLSAERLAARLADRHATASSHDARAVQLMTMHRAKGLEFDHVILPGLGRTPRSEQQRLLLWREELVGDADDESLLLAPIPIKGESALYAYLRARDAGDATAEVVRLLYVALTRARREIHLLGHARVGEDGECRPASASFLALMWPRVADAFTRGLHEVTPGTADTPARGADGAAASVLLRRAELASLPPLETALAASPAGDAAVSVTAVVEFDWAGITARHVGTVTHRLLQELAQHPARFEGTAWRAPAARFARGQLRALGVAEGALDDAVAQVSSALANTLASTRGRWLFASSHGEAAAELCLTSHEVDASRRVIIDRTFVDDQGRRWVVDFKTGSHAGGGREAWLDSEQARYRPQLERYAAILARSEPRPIMLGLYFPLLDAWREWAYRPLAERADDA